MSLNVGAIFTEFRTAVEANDSDIFGQIATAAGNLSKNTTKGQLIIEGLTLLDAIAAKVPDPRVQMAASIAGGVIQLAQELYGQTAAPATAAVTAAVATQTKAGV